VKRHTETGRSGSDVGLKWVCSLEQFGDRENGGKSNSSKQFIFAMGLSVATTIRVGNQKA
jgi:hypothetical protein